MALLGFNVPPEMQKVLNEEAAAQGEVAPAYVGRWAPGQERTRVTAMNNAVATVKPDSVAVGTPTEELPWEVMWHQASVLVKSGFLPNSIKTPEQAVAIILTGQEMGIPKMLALRSIDVIQGVPSVKPDLMAALVQREIDRHGDGLLLVLEPTETECTVRYRRWGWPEEQRYTYTLEDAKRAGLLNKDNWKAHLRSMLRVRATGGACRLGFPDVVRGLHLEGEVERPETPRPAPSPVTVLPQPQPQPQPAAIAPARGAEFEAASAANEEEHLSHLLIGDGGMEVIDAETGEILPAQQTEIPQNGVAMMTKQQRGKILFLAGKLGLGEDGNTTLEDFCSAVTGISNIDNLSEQRAAQLTVALEQEVASRKR